MIIRPDNTRRLCLTTLILVLSALACALPAPTTGTTPPDNTASPAPKLAIRISTTPTTPAPAVVTAAEALHVRQEPGEKALVIGYLRNGNEVTLTGRCSQEPDPVGWAEIAYRDGSAWVNADFLSSNKCSEMEEK